MGTRDPHRTRREIPEQNPGHLEIQEKSRQETVRRNDPRTRKFKETPETEFDRHHQ